MPDERQKVLDDLKTARDELHEISMSAVALRSAMEEALGKLDDRMANIRHRSQRAADAHARLYYELNPDKR